MASKKQTLSQKRAAQAKRLERNLPAKGGAGETVISNAELRRTINILKGNKNGR